MNTEGIKPLFTQKLTEISTRLSKPLYIKTRDDFPYSPHFAHLGKLINAAKKNNIEITFFINPYHFSYLQTLVDKGQWENFLLWKKTLVEYLAVTKHTKFGLWDFSGFSDVVNEKVPLKTPRKQMQWFWEPAHYRKELGDIILTTLYNDSPSLPNFGRKLTIENIYDTNPLEYPLLESSSLQWQKLKEHLNLKIRN
jgi:hypothetical protein